MRVRGGAALATAAPFHLEATVRVLQRRPNNLVDVWASSRYRRALSTPAGLALVEVVETSFERLIERFGPQRGYLYFCALGGSLLSKQLIHPAPLYD